MKTKVTVARELKTGVRVHVESDRLSEDGSMLSFKFSHEGLVIDYVDSDGNVIKSSSQMFDEIEANLK